MYSDKCDSLPTVIETSKLKFTIGHAPLAREAFAKGPGTLVKVKPMSESELEGYRIYLETMRGNRMMKPERADAKCLLFPPCSPTFAEFRVGVVTRLP